MQDLNKLLFPPAPPASPSGTPESPPGQAVPSACGPACCGGESPPPAVAAPPGFRVEPFVTGWAEAGGRRVPLVATRLSPADRLGTLRVRLGIGRTRYRVAPGLYGVGAPGQDSPVLATANYKLSFDALRRELAGPPPLDAWLLVLDTRGINVWCAAGKGTMSAAEAVRRAREANLGEVVTHRRIVLPQFAAPGVTLREIRQGCGFSGVFGPVRASDLPAFLRAGMVAGPEMRRVTFTLAERLALVPVELGNGLKRVHWVAAALFLLSGIGPGWFSPRAAWTRGLAALMVFLAGLLAGGAAVPALLPWLPGRALSAKGASAGAAAGLALAAAIGRDWPWTGMTAAVLGAAAAGSYFAMQFTGSTPYTSPSGVEKEMRRALPLQGLALLAAAGLWIAAALGARSLP